MPGGTPRDIDDRVTMLPSGKAEIRILPDMPSWPDRGAAKPPLQYPSRPCAATTLPR